MAVRWQRSILVNMVTALTVTIVAVTALATPGPVRVRAQENGDELDEVRRTVQTWLLQTLGKPNLALVEYTYDGTSWPDRSLGCPVEGETYQEGTVHGYEWTFQFNNMVRYTVHSSIDGKIAVLCSALNVTDDVSLTQYANTEFTLLIPEEWLVYPGDKQVLFAPQAQPTCDQPGMRVITVGRVASGVTPDQLLDDHLAEIGASDTPTERETVGTLGRSTRYQAACDEVTRHWRVSAFVQYGSAFRIEQWAPVDEADQWDPQFLNMLSPFGPSDGILTPGPSAPATAGSTGTNAGGVVDVSALPALPLVHLFSGDVFMGALNDIPGRTVTRQPLLERRYLSFSPDGLTIGYINITDRQLRTMSAADGVSSRRVAVDINTEFPPAWSPDGARVAYVIDSEETDHNGAAVLAIMAAPALGGEIEQMGSFAYHGGCEVESGDPADEAYFNEAGPGGVDNVLAWLPDDQFLISTGCGRSLSLLQPETATRIDLGADLEGGALAPDHGRFAARTTDGIAVLDFTDWQRTNLHIGQRPDQIAWSADGTAIYYSTVTLSDETTLDDPAQQERAEEVFGRWPLTIGVYDLTIARLDLITSQESVLWQGQGRAIGRIAPAPDGSGVLFTFIPNGLLVLEAFQSGADAFALRITRPAPGLFWLPTDSTAATLLAYSGQPAFAAITLPGE